MQRPLDFQEKYDDLIDLYTDKEEEVEGNFKKVLELLNDTQWIPGEEDDYLPT